VIFNEREAGPTDEEEAERVGTMNRANQSLHGRGIGERTKCWGRKRPAPPLSYLSAADGNVTSRI